MKQGKVWGETTSIFKCATGSSHFLKIKKGGYCSKHMHSQKTNVFFVIRGHIQISIWNEGQGKDMEDKTILSPGQTTTIPIGVYHMFEALTEVEAVEAYEFRFMGDDIFRETVGGMRTAEKKK